MLVYKKHRKCLGVKGQHVGNLHLNGKRSLYHFYNFLSKKIALKKKRQMLLEKSCKITEKEPLDIAKEKVVSAKVSVGENAHIYCGRMRCKLDWGRPD